VNPDGYQRNVVPEDELSIRAAIADYLPAADGRLVAAETCLYTQTADTNFLIDRLPGWPRIVVASPCSGHGFKFAPIIGERLADLVTTGMPPDDIVQFGLSRFTQK
jgi:sarcosine oxidase